MRDIVIVDRGYPGGGATGRNVARIRAMQLTEELTHVALACQAKYDRMGEELGFNVLFYRLGYAWVLYEPDEVERMRAIVDMHHRIGVASRFLSPDETLRHLPVLRGGDPVAGAVLNDDAIVHHDAVVWAHLEHLAAPGAHASGSCRERRSPASSAATPASKASRRRAAGSPREPSSTAPAAGRASSTPWPACPPRTGRSGARSSSPRPLRRTIEAAITFYRPNEGWFNQTLRGEVVMGVVDPDETSGVNQGSSWDFLRRTAALMTRKAPALADVTVIRQWAGMYDISPDHQPLVGPTRQLDGWWQANGWSGRACCSGRTSRSSWRSGSQRASTPPRLAAFDPDRFAPDEAPEEAAGDYYARYATRS